MRISHLPYQISLTRPERFLLLVLAGILCALTSGCGVGAIIGGAVIGVVAALNDDSSSSGPVVAPEVLLVQGPSRTETQSREDATTIPLCIEVFGDPAPGQLIVQFAREVDDFRIWYDASESSEELTPRPSCNTVFWWDAGSDFALPMIDMDLTKSAEKVQVRVFFDSPESAEESGVFDVGNSRPQVFFKPEKSPENPGGGIVLSIQATDKEADPLRDFRLEYRTGEDGKWKDLCGSDGSFCEPVCDESVELPINIDENSLPIPITWNPNCLSDFRQRNASVELRLIARDDFEQEVTDFLTFPVENNRPPSIEIVGERDQSFELPIFFDLFESDCADPGDLDCGQDFQPVDVIVQYKLVEDDDFPELPEDFDLDRAFRCRALDPASPEFEAFADFRKAFRIATPRSQVCGLRATPEGVQHLFLWHSSRDLPPFAADLPVTIQMTPYDEAAGTADTANLQVDNDIYPVQQRLVQRLGTVGGIATGDLNGDGRDDTVYSLSEQGRVMICLADDGGPSSPAAGRCDFIDLPGERASPTELAVIDMNGDGQSDLVVLDRRCPIASCRAPGAVYVYYGTGSEPILETDPRILVTGRDARSVCVGNFDGRPGLDIAVSNHDDISVSVFLNDPEDDSFLRVPGDILLGTIEAFRPGMLICADFDRDEQGLDEIAVRLRVANEVRILSWASVDELLDGNVRSTRLTVSNPISLTSADFNGDNRPDLAVGTADDVCLLRNSGSQGSNLRFVEVDGDFKLEDAVEQLRVAPLSNPGEFLFVLLTQESTGTARFVRALFQGDARTTSFKSLPLPLPPDNTDLPGSLLVHDFDGDGLVDVVLGGLQGAAYLRSEGPGSLTANLAQRLPLARVTSLTVLDRDCGFPAGFTALTLGEDGDENTTYRLSIYVQDPLRGFVPDWTSNAQVVTQPQLFLATGDHSKDGCTDVIAVNHSQGIHFFLKHGEFLPDPIFSPQDRITVGPIALGELDSRDGIDLLELTLDFTDVGALASLSLKSLDFSTPGAVTVETREPGLSTGNPFGAQLLTGDLDGDGWPDLVLPYTGATGDFVDVRLQDRSQPWPLNFATSLDSLPQLPAGFLIDDAWLAHVNADDDLDLLFLGTFPLRLLVFRSTGNPSNLFPEMQEATLPLGAQDVIVADFSNDRLADLIVSSGSSLGQDALLKVIFQREDETFPEFPSRNITLDGFGEGFVQLGVADVTNDTRPDLIVYGSGANGTWILQSR